jgi:chemotaxis protein MotA
MDVGTLIGCILGGLLIFCAIVFGGHDGFAPFWNVPALLVVFGCTAAAVLIAFPLKPILKSFSSVQHCFLGTKIHPKDIIDQLVFFAESARREGLLAQENRLGNVCDPFLAEGLHLIVDGLSPATVENILISDMEAIQYRQQQERNILLHCGKCAPAFGMLGTIIGLVLMLTRLDAASVGPGMAMAILTTFYGVLASHLFFLPIAEKLKQRHEAEMQIKSMIVRGVLAIQSGEHPRIIQSKLLTFLPPEERPNDEERIMASDVQVIPMPMEEDEEKAQAA